MRLLSDGGGGVRATTTSRGGGRGMALLMVITAIAVLTAVAVDFSYNVRVDAALARNARDELRAYYMARSATALSRLLLRMQYQVDQQAGQLARTMTAAVPGMDQSMVQSITNAVKNIKLWSVVPIDSTAITTFVGAAASGTPQEVPLSAPEAVEPGKPMPAEGLPPFGTFDGSFHATISDEESKINVNKLNNPGSLGAIAGQQLALLWQDQKWDFLFDEDTSWKERMPREDYLIHVKDWLDEDPTESVLNVASPAEMFGPGFGDEGAPYSRYDPTYEPKNALMDSLGEMYQVAGVTDRFMAAFGDKLTVYPDINSRLNVNSPDPFMTVLTIMAAAENPNDPALKNPATLQVVLDEIGKAQALGPFVNLTVPQFVSILETAGIKVKAEVKHNAAANNYLGDTSATFTIKAVGQVGDVTKTLTTVVRYNAGMGRILYYRED
jgi:general secretion pathway protein K